MGLSDEEYNKVREILGREPNFTEVGIFSVMWSEHCSYKHSKPFLKQFRQLASMFLWDQVKVLEL